MKPIVILITFNQFKKKGGERVIILVSRSPLCCREGLTRLEYDGKCMQAGVKQHLPLVTLITSDFVFLHTHKHSKSPQGDILH